MSATLTATTQPVRCELRSRQRFDFDWRFHRGDVPDAQRPDLDDSAWRELNLPHDWSIELAPDKDAPAWGSGGWFPGGIGWYRKSFDWAADNSAHVVWIEFDGVYHNSDVWINGVHLGRRPYGYVSFHYDLTPHLRSGARNVIAVRVDNSDQPNCRWYSGSGIYRHVWLSEMSAAAHVAHWGTYVTTPEVSQRSATVRVRTQVDSSAKYEVRTIIHDASGNVVTETRDETCRINAPQFWSPDRPAMYYARSVVSVDGKPVDDFVTPFGIRDARFDSKLGFVLNGAPLKMKGVCLHHDGGCVGAAVPDGVLERRLRILKEIGCNAIRTSHNPPAPELLDLCDRMGFLVIDEAFDKWEGAFSKPKDWWMRQKDFATEWERDLRSMLERDRNHPCVVMWSVGNETGAPGTEEVDPTLKRLVEFTKREEPTRAVSAALVHSFAPTPEQRVQHLLNSSKLVDVLCLNYQEPLYPHLRAVDPNVIICGSECFKHWRGGEMDVRVYDPRNPWYDVPAHDYVVGQFLWPGIDYLGESDKWPNLGWAGGTFDTCGFAKPESWFHRSVWRPDEPLVRIAVVLDDGPSWPWGAPTMVEHWNFPKMDGRLLRVRTQTNCETVELVLNNKHFGVRRASEHVNSSIEWFVPYAAGTIEAIARNGDREVARHTLKTSGTVAKIELLADRASLAADGLDVAHVEVRLLDEHGIVVPNDDRAISFEVAGDASLIGVDNGDFRDLTPFKGKVRQTRSGRCLAIVQSTRKRGRATVSASADGLPGTALELTTT